MMSMKLGRSFGPESAKPGRLVDGKLVNEDDYFCEWTWVADDWAKGGGYFARQGYVELDESTPYNWCEYVDDGVPVWAVYSGVLELIQIKSDAVEGYCTILGDLSMARRAELPCVILDPHE